MLLESKIIFLSKDLNRLSFCVRAASNLIKKMSIEAKIYPIFPTYDKFKDILDMPFASVFGYPDDPTRELIDFFSDKFDLIIDITKGQFIKERRIPQLQKSMVLIKGINDLLEKEKPAIRILPKLTFNTIIQTQKTSPEFVTFRGEKNENIYPCCFKFFAETLYVFNPKLIQRISDMLHIIPFTFKGRTTLNEKIKLCIVSDTTDSNHPVSVLNEDIFLNSFVDEDQETKIFMSAFLSTQIFSQFIEKIVDEHQIDISESSVRARCAILFSEKIETIKRNSKTVSRAHSKGEKSNS